MARPLKTTEPLTEIIPFRLSKSERAKLVELAEREGLGVADLVRSYLLKAKPRAARRATPEQLQLIGHLGELGKIGSNLNQIARRLNSGEHVQQQELKLALEAVYGLADVLRDQLGKL